MISKGDAPLNGLVLAGGRSTRMGSDKGSMQWHGKEQRLYIADMLRLLCDAVYISCRKDQEAVINKINYPVITDAYENMGPAGAILTAFQKQPDVAWMVMACDLPLLDEATLRFLVAHRDTNAMATTFESPHDHLPEPLITIWEPRSYATLLSNVEAGKSCPRKSLLNNDVHILQAPDPITLMNVNTKEDTLQVKHLIGENK